MGWTVEEVVTARDTFAGLLEELRLADHLFGIEPREQGWAVRVECRSREGSRVASFGIEAGVLERCQRDPLIHRRLRRFLSERLGDCIRSARASAPPAPPREDGELEDAARADPSTLAAMSEYSSTAGGSQRSEPPVLLPPPFVPHAMSHTESPDPVRNELYWYALEQATQDPHPPEADLPAAEDAAMHVMTDDDDDRGTRRRPRDGQSRVSDIMTRDVDSIPPSAPMEDVRELFAALALQHLPVTEGDRLVGVISSNDLLRVRIDPPRPSMLKGHLQARHLMQTTPVTVRETATVREAAATLCDGSTHALPVVDAEQRLVGMVTSTDLIRVLDPR